MGMIDLVESFKKQKTYRFVVNIHLSYCKQLQFLNNHALLGKELLLYDTESHLV